MGIYQNCVINQRDHTMVNIFLAICAVGGVFILGIFLLTIFMVLRYKKTATIPVIIYINMMFCDVLYGAFTAPFRIYYYSCGTTNTVVCYIILCAGRACGLISIVSIFLMSLERYIKIKFYKSYDYYFSYRKIWIAIMWIWIASFTYGFIIEPKWPNMWIHRTNLASLKCNVMHYFWTASIFIDLLLLKSVLLIISTSINIKLYFYVKRYFQNMEVKLQEASQIVVNEKHKKHLHVEHEILFTSIAISATYIIMMFPTFIFGLIKIIFRVNIPEILAVSLLILRLAYPIVESFVFLYFNKTLIGKLQKFVVSLTSSSRKVRDSFSS